MKAAFNLPAVCFGVFWSVLTLLADGFIGHTMVRRLQANYFATTTGVVTRSELKTSQNSEGDHQYKAIVHYRFQVGERTFEGTNYHLAGDLLVGEKQARRLVKEHRVGEPVAVYFRLEDPAQAALKRGFDGAELFALVFLTPFNGVMVAFWGVAIHRRRKQRVLAQPVSGGGMAPGRTVVLPLSACPPVVTGAAVAAAIAFPAILGVGFATDMEPGWTSGSISAALVVAGGLVAYVRSKLRAGWSDLVLDFRSEVLTLPAGFGRTRPTRIPFAEVTRVEVEEVLTPSEDGTNTATYAATVLLTDGRRERWEETPNRGQMENLVKWLAERLPSGGTYAIAGGAKPSR